MHQSGESEPFVDEILRLLHRITVDLSPQQVRCLRVHCVRPLMLCAVAGPYLLRGCRVHDFGATEQATAGEAHRETHGIAK